MGFEVVDSTKKGPEGMISPERLYLTADRETVVKHGDERARYLLVAEGGFIDVALARRYGIADESGAWVPLGSAPVIEAAPEVTSDAATEATRPPVEAPPKPAAKAPAFKPPAE